MSFSRLLMVAANSKKYIVGEGNDKVIIPPKNPEVARGRDLYDGEVILCFQLDERSDREKKVSKCLGIEDDQSRCDGLVFYSQDGETNRVICLVEMKSTDIKRAADQINTTKEHLTALLREECNCLPEAYHAQCLKQIANITWKACLYHHSSSPGDRDEFHRTLKSKGFADVDELEDANNDLRPLLTGTGLSAKERAKKLRGYKQPKHRK